MSDTENCPELNPESIVQAANVWERYYYYEAWYTWLHVFRAWSEANARQEAQRLTDQAYGVETDK